MTGLALRGVAAVAGALLLAGCGAGSRAASGTPAPAAAPASTVPDPPPGQRISKVLTVIEENHSLAEVRRDMPYLGSLATRFGYATDYLAVGHPSLPNYLALSGGSPSGVRDDRGPAAHPQAGPSVFGQALAAGLTAKVYAESMPQPCALDNSGAYAVRHTGWPYYPAERAQCRAGQLPLSAFAGDVAAGALPAVGWLVPDLTHDAHDGTLAVADSWLRVQLAPVLAGADFRSGRLAVVVTTDEDDRSSGNTVLTVVAAAGLHGRVVSERLSHLSLAGLYSDVTGRPRLRDAAAAPSLAAAFGLSVGPGAAESGATSGY